MSKNKYKLVCVNNKPIDGKSNKTQSLTIGKVYETYDDIVDGNVCVINDLGNEVNYHCGRFITLEEWRESRLNKVLKDK
jgi:hypothetical protein